MAGKYVCENCGKSYQSKSGLWRHEKKCMPEGYIEDKVEAPKKEETMVTPEEPDVPVKAFIPEPMSVEAVVVKTMDEKLAKMDKKSPRYAKLKARRDKLAESL